MKYSFFCYFKHEIQLFKVLLSLKLVKFDTKMYLNFSNFRGQTSAGGDKPWSENGDKCRMGGGIGKIFARWGTPSPPRKKPCLLSTLDEGLGVRQVETLLFLVTVSIISCFCDEFWWYLKQNRQVENKLSTWPSLKVYSSVSNCRCQSHLVLRKMAVSVKMCTVSRLNGLDKKNLWNYL